VFSASDQVLLRIQPLPLANMVHDLHLRGEMTRIAAFTPQRALSPPLSSCLGPLRLEPVRR
jgi:hypothetical protein